ncbi:MAG: hypothetical protein GC154_10850 [bacterium]|nr:hypothetical protein [bacterium]
MRTHGFTRTPLACLCLMGVFCAGIAAYASTQYELQSPNNKISITFNAGDALTYQMNYEGKPVVAPSRIGMKFDGSPELGVAAEVKKSDQGSGKDDIEGAFGPRSSIHDAYNTLRIEFVGGYALEARAYNDGWAYRLETSRDGELIVKNEIAQLNFGSDLTAYAAYCNSKDFRTPYEEFFKPAPISKMDKEKYIFLPIVARADDGVTVAYTEADVLDYPAMYLQPDSTQPGTLTALFPPYPAEIVRGSYNNSMNLVGKQADYIAKVKGKRSFPWRTFIVTKNDADLLSSDLVYRLSTPPDPSMDFSWVRPGLAAWEWYCNRDITGVDFKVGFNTDTYKYYVDFAAKYGIPYISVDEGWYENNDVLDIAPELDLHELFRYADSKGVGVLLWCMGALLEDKLDEALPLYEKWGVKGLKVDFFERDDQDMMRHFERLVSECAKHHLMVNFHGVTKPTGLRRTFPNLINREAVRGMEYNKFNETPATPTHICTLPYTRMLAGPMDFTPGAMRNVPLGDFKTDFNLPMAVGTRCQQLALYVLYNAPLQMVSGSPTAYMKEPEIIQFIASVPTVWDETVPLEGKIAECAVIARRKGSDWFVGGVTNEDARDITVDFSFLSNATYRSDVFVDGVNADRNGIDFKREHYLVKKGDTKTFHLAPGGGFAIRLEPR